MADAPASPSPAAKPTPAKAEAARPAAPGQPVPSASAKAPAPPAPPPPEPKGDYAMLRDAHADEVTAYSETEDGAGCLTVTPEGLFTVAAEVKAMGYSLLSLLSAYDRGDHFGVLYAFLKPTATQAGYAELRLRVVMPKKDAAGAAAEPACPSLVDLFPAADWQEREMFDMYGITFEGHPDLRRMFLPADWHGHPMRKDYKEAEQFVGMREGEDVTYRTQEEGSW